MLCLSACRSDDTPPGHLRAVDPVLHFDDRGLEVRAGIGFEPGDAVREALQRGVPIRLAAEVRISRRLGPVAIQKHIGSTPLTIHWQPLTDQWLLSGPDGTQNYPRLWMLLDALADPRDFDAGISRDELGKGRWQVQFRVRLAREALPAPMQLPALFAPQWRLRTEWVTWQLDES
ncbi:MAG: hypothetical protein Kow0020_00450 [Wenzhouxiangellaceae bacterium]